MKITVTNQDIEDGHRENPYSCPVALAIKRVTSENVVVANESVAIGDRHLHLPDAACEFILGFDDYDMVKPFSFELPL